MRSSTVVRLNNGVAMPTVGLGVFQAPPEQTRSAVEAALAAGDRHIDTAASYDNERQVGGRGGGLPGGVAGGHAGAGVAVGCLVG